MSGRPGELSVRWVAKNLKVHIKTVRRWCRACDRGDTRWFRTVRVAPDGSYWIPEEEYVRVATGKDDGGLGGRFRHSETSHVYFIAAKEMPIVKIGVALDPDKRLRELQVGCPLRLTMLAFVEGGRGDEIALHKRFAHLRTIGEWFRLDGALAAYVASLSGNIREHHQRPAIAR